MHVTPTNSKVSQLERDINNAAVNLSKLLIRYTPSKSGDITYSKLKYEMRDFFDLGLAKSGRHGNVWY
jgi:hypothetical protein